MEMIYLRKKVTAVLLFILAAAPVDSSPLWDIRIEPDWYAVLTGLKSELTSEELMEASFYFSPSGRSKFASYMDKYRKILADFKTFLSESNKETASGAEKGELLLQFLHENILVRYEEYETDLGVLIDKGTFNCVSSGIIYYALAEDSGLEVKGVLTRDHVFCAVSDRSERSEGHGSSYGTKETIFIDVETTTAYGFNPGEKKEFADSFGKTGFVYTSPGNYREREFIGKKEFLALILQNRISELQKKNNFSESVPLSADRFFILNTRKSFNDMISEFKNFCAVLNNRKQFTDALYFLECVYLQYGSSQPLSETASTLFQNSIIDYLSTGDTDAAFDFYRKYRKFPLIPERMKHTQFFDINEKELYLTIQKSSFSESLAVLDSKNSNNEISEEVFSEYLVYIYSAEIEKTANMTGWESALAVAEEALERTDDKRILQLKKAVVYNIGVIYHNRFAEFFNNQEYSNAIKTVEEGLRIVPDDKKLLNDRSRLKKFLEHK